MKLTLILQPIENAAVDYGTNLARGLPLATVAEGHETGGSHCDRNLHNEMRALLIIPHAGSRAGNTSVCAGSAFDTE
ncbi:MAG: hypothetical protein JO122_15485 [Acetobacteraceae bacterium]|nr:hypothetical protein [Acetobacteraceae bacterium]